jgi:nicotinamide-nucleotide amidase
MKANRCAVNGCLRCIKEAMLSRTLPPMENSDSDLARLAVRVGRHMVAQGRRVATAESCTGGWISKVLTDIAGSSDWFSEGFVTYSNEAKEHRLGVAHRLLIRHGAVSRAAAEAMARGALLRSHSQVVVAVTGIAGPGGAVPGKPVGTVWLAWAYRRRRAIRVVVVLKRFRGNRETVRRKTVRVALQGLLKIPS